MQSSSGSLTWDSGSGFFHRTAAVPEEYLPGKRFYKEKEFEKLC